MGKSNVNGKQVGACFAYNHGSCTQSTCPYPHICGKYALAGLEFAHMIVDQHKHLVQFLWKSFSLPHGRTQQTKLTLTIYVLDQGRKKLKCEIRIIGNGTGNVTTYMLQYQTSNTLSDDLLDSYQNQGCATGMLFAI